MRCTARLIGFLLLFTGCAQRPTGPMVSTLPAEPGGLADVSRDAMRIHHEVAEAALTPK